MRSQCVLGMFAKSFLNLLGTLEAHGTRVNANVSPIRETWHCACEVMIDVRHRALISFISASDLNSHHPDWLRPFTQETQIQIKWLLTLKCLKNCLCICQTTSAIDEAVLKKKKKLHLKNQWRGSRNSRPVNYKSFSIICGFFLPLWRRNGSFSTYGFCLSVLTSAGALQ